MQFMKIKKTFNIGLQLLLLKRGGEEIYVGPLGRHSVHLINYFEVRLITIWLWLLWIANFTGRDYFYTFYQEIDGVPKIKDGYNPATWMLEVTSPGEEATLGVNFPDIYKNSELYR